MCLFYVNEGGFRTPAKAEVGRYKEESLDSRVGTFTPTLTPLWGEKNSWRLSQPLAND